MKHINCNVHRNQAKISTRDKSLRIVGEYKLTFFIYDDIKVLAFLCSDVESCYFFVKVLSYNHDKISFLLSVWELVSSSVVLCASASGLSV